MLDAQSPSRGATPSAIPLKRSYEEDHTPTISSPLNPDAPPRSSQGPAVRGQREKKETLKKRESTAGSASSKRSSPDVANNASAAGNSKKKIKTEDDKPTALSPLRYGLPQPKEVWHYVDKELVWASHEPDPYLDPGGRELKRPLDHTENKKAYRYMHCVADSAFPHSNWYRNSDEKPFTPHMSFSDSDKWFHFDESARVVTNEKGWRMGRGNVVAREGSYYYEVKILKGVPSEEKPASPVTSSPTVGKDDPLASSIIQNGTITPANGSMSNGISRRPSGPSPIVGPTPHVRIGWARREAPLDAPVGFDGYSYGLTDSRMEPMHKSRAHKFLDNGDDKPPPASKQKPKSKTTSKSKSGVATAAGTKSGPGASDTAGQFSANDSVREGDTIGLSITLPSLSLHRKIASGQYNPLADVGAGLNSLGYDDGSAHNIVRDRFAVPYKNSMFFESIQYSSSKGMDGYGDRGPFSKETPSTNHSDPTLRSLPGSNIKVWKNGKLIGTAFRDLMAFLPPCSQPAAEKGVRSGLDDGMVGYYPAIGVFSGAIAEVNFGPDFWCKPQEVEWAPSTAEKCDTMGNKDTTDSVDVTMKETGGDEDTTDKGPGSDTQVKNETAEDTTMQNAEDTSGAATNSPTDKTSSNSPETATQPNQHKSTSPQVEQQKSNGSRRASSGRKITLPSLAPICERYKEQIAEDVVYDVIDEASFWVSDGAPATS